MVTIEPPALCSVQQLKKKVKLVIHFVLKSNLFQKHLLVTNVVKMHWSMALKVPLHAPNASEPT